MKVQVDLQLCQAYANCLLAAPDVFDLDEEGSNAVILQEHPSEDLREAVEEAVRDCPTQAISISEK